MKEITFAIIKPDAVSARNTGNIIKMIEDHGFEIVRMLKGRLHTKDAETFYAIHKDKPFFGELVEFITSGPIVIMALEKENAIADWRKLMGATDSLKAEEGTVRKAYGTDISHNAVHGSDASETAKQELSLFFPELAQ
jgi:nucleoside-diphosphate kinase